MKKDSEKIERLLNVGHDDFINTLKTIGIKPLLYLIDIENKIKKFKQNKFTSLQEKTMIAQYIYKDIETIIEIMYSRYSYGKRINKDDILNFMKFYGILPTMEIVTSVLHNAYNRNSHYWKIVYKYVKSCGMENAIGYLSSDFFRKYDDQKITYTDAYEYMMNVIDMDMNRIKEFESVNSVVFVEEYYDSMQWDFMVTMDMKSLVEDNVKKYIRKFTIDISYPRRWACIGMSGAGKSLAKLLLLEFYSHSHKIVHLNDVNAEMWYAKKPSRRGKDLNEFDKKPEGLKDMVIFSLPPYKLEASSNEMKKIDKILHINPKALKIPDWSALLDLNITQQSAFGRVFRNIGELNGAEDLLSAIINSTMHSGTKNTIITKLENIMGQELFSSVDVDEISSMILDKKNYSFDTSLIYDDGLKRGITSYILRLIADASKRKKIDKPYCIAIEELQNIVYGTIRNTRFEYYLSEIFRRLRVSETSVITIQQNMGDLPDWAIPNISNWVIMRIRDSKQTERLRKTMGYDLAQCMDILPYLENEHALFIDEKDVVAGRIIPPSCHHKYPSKKKI